MIIIDGFHLSIDFGLCRIYFYRIFPRYGLKGVQPIHILPFQMFFGLIGFVLSMNIFVFACKPTLCERMKKCIDIE